MSLSKQPKSRAKVILWQWEREARYTRENQDGERKAWRKKMKNKLSPRCSKLITLQAGNEVE